MTMLVKHAMDTTPAICNQFDSVQDAAMIMKRNRISFLPVAENEPPHTYVGAITHRDLVHAIAEGATADSKISELARYQKIFARRDDPIEKAIQTMERNDLSGLAVLDRERQVIGVISLADASKYLNRAGSETTSLRATNAAPTRSPAAATKRTGR